MPTQIRATTSALRRVVTRPSPAPMRALFAIGLSVLCPGWGHVYAGARLRGLHVLAAIALIVIPAWAIAGAGMQGAPATTIAAGGAWLLWVAFPLDAARFAFRQRPPNSLGAVALAAIFLFAGTTVLAAELSWIRERYVAVYRMPTPSMLPTLVPGDHFLVDVRPTAAPTPGDVVVFQPAEPGAPVYAKRVVATAGSRVSMRQGRLVVDGVRRDRATDHHRPGHHREELGGQRYSVRVDRGRAFRSFTPFVVPAGHVFVLGDNRGESIDSRYFGPVPLENIKGRVLRVLWSWDADRERLRWARIGRAVGPLVSLP